MPFFNKLKCSLLALALAAGVQGAQAQRVAVKTNALYWLTASPNLGLEFRMSRHFSLNIEAAGNPFTIKDTKLHHATFNPELRYWFSARPQAGHFVGVMGFASAYDLHAKSRYHKGDAYGVGLTYGYSLVLSKHWSMEATAGLGVLRYREKKFRDGQAQPKGVNHKGFTPAPTKLGLTFVYIFK